MCQCAVTTDVLDLVPTEIHNISTEAQDNTEST